jgi:uncharacterized protein YecE (DUF72 family)
MHDLAKLASSLPAADPHPATAIHTIRIGPAGWSYLDWAGIAYPRIRPHGFHETEYLARFFDVIEINTSFYQPIRADMARSWAMQVRAHPRFQFTAKLWRRFTHDRDAGHDEERAAKQGLNALAEAGKLGALLMQFPWSFKWTKENREYLGSLVMQFLEYPLVLEVRHSSWNSPEAFDLMGELGIGFCNVDQPIIGRSLAPTAETVGPVGYVRLHGRNYNHWFAHSEPYERYNYLYSMDELEPWAKRATRVAERAQSTFVITNNHFEAKGVANALEIEALITGKPVPVPETMVKRYPELKSIEAPPTPGDDNPASTASSPEQGTLSFDSPS